MAATTANYGFGDLIHYVDFAGIRRAVLVSERDDDIKNGRPGFVGILIKSTNPADVRDGPETVWGYDDQITIIERKT